MADICRIRVDFMHDLHRPTLQEAIEACAAAYRTVDVRFARCTSFTILDVTLLSLDLDALRVPMLIVEDIADRTGRFQWQYACLAPEDVPAVALLHEWTSAGSYLIDAFQVLADVPIVRAYAVAGRFEFTCPVPAQSV